MVSCKTTIGTTIGNGHDQFSNYLLLVEPIYTIYLHPYYSNYTRHTIINIITTNNIN